MLFFFYTSTSGQLMPNVSNLNVQELRDLYVDSVTPLGKIFSVSKRKDALLIIALLEAQLTHTHKTQTGLIDSLETCIETLKTFNFMRKS